MTDFLLRNVLTLAFIFAMWGVIVCMLVRILRRMGFSGWWVLMLVLWPIGLAMLAYADWPAFAHDRK